MVCLSQVWATCVLAYKWACRVVTFCESIIFVPESIMNSSSFSYHSLLSAMVTILTAAADIGRVHFCCQRNIQLWSLSTILRVEYPIPVSDLERRKGHFNPVIHWQHTCGSTCCCTERRSSRTYPTSCFFLVDLSTEKHCKNTRWYEHILGREIVHSYHKFNRSTL